MRTRRTLLGTSTRDKDNAVVSPASSGSANATTVNSKLTLPIVDSTTSIEFSTVVGPMDAVWEAVYEVI